MTYVKTARATRFASVPDAPAPQLACPICGSALLYRQTVYGGISPPEKIVSDLLMSCDRFVTFFREHQWPSTLEYSEHPYVSCAEIKKALKVKAALSDALDQMQ